eukprot:TRINITY_DN12815_c0_g2_i1.p1 TRINITY_DN12815_c0_g2~~TRINITY_DN12815_c0_g2_i1.p1  ORF type:complete len:1056 (-),score=243.01 TRINITY_DN12815_c0_g2_i1:85-3012(-)
MCSATCRISREECRRHNVRATWYVNATLAGVAQERYVCHECPIKGCERCASDGETCERCFPSFTLTSGSCIIMYEQAVLDIVIFCASLVLVIFLFLVCTTYGMQVFVLKGVSMATSTFRKGLQGLQGGSEFLQASSDRELGDSNATEEEKKEEEAEKKLGLTGYDEQDELSEDEEDEGGLVGDTQVMERGFVVAERGFVMEAEGLGQRLLSDIRESEGVGEISKKQRKVNSRAIQHGLYFAKRSSVMAGLGGWTDMCSRSSVTADVGVGLPLFFNFQGFLLLVSLIVYAAMYVFETQFGFTNEIQWLQSEDKAKCSNGYGLELIKKHANEYAFAMAITCLILWLILLPLSWAFAVFQFKVTMREFDRRANTFEDYSVKLKNLPRTLTSERRLQEIVEEKLQAQGKLHGVCLTYDVQTPKLEARLREMIENLVQMDDLDRGWCTPLYSRPREELEAAIEQDRADFIGMLERRELQNSGEGFLVYKRQRDVKVMLQVYRGIELDKEVFEQEFGQLDDSKQDYYVMPLRGTMTEPPGVEWYNYNQPIQKRVGVWLLLHAGSIGMFGFFGWCSYLFYQYMMVPYLDAGSPPDQNDMSLQILGNFVGVINAGIQAAIQGGAAFVGYTRAHSTDRTIFRLNTVVVALNIATQMFFFAYRGGFVRLLGHSGARSLDLEAQFASNIKVIMVPNMFFVQYLLNEFFTALLPSTLSFVVLKMIYELQTGAMCIRQMLLNLLPFQPKSITRLTGRDAELNMRLPQLLMSLEYSFAIVYPAAAFSIVFLFTDQMTEMTSGLVLFAIFFYVYQRFCSLWMYRMTIHDSPVCFQAAMSAWGLVVSIFPTASVWWLWRLNLIPYILGNILLPATFFACSSLHQYGLDNIDSFMTKLGVFEDVCAEDDPGVEGMMKARGYTWWNVNPVYVLKNRYCPDLPGYECLGKDVRCWPEGNDVPESYYESGTRFRQAPYPRALKHRQKLRAKSQLL